MQFEDLVYDRVSRAGDECVVYRTNHISYFDSPNVSCRSVEA